MYGLLSSDLDFMEKVFTRFPEIQQAVLYGSRAKGNFKKGSDIDLALKGEGLGRTVTAVWGILNDEAPFAYDVDVLDYASLTNQNLKEHIDRVGITIYSRTG